MPSVVTSNSRRKINYGTSLHSIRMGAGADDANPTDALTFFMASPKTSFTVKLTRYTLSPHLTALSRLLSSNMLRRFYRILRHHRFHIFRLQLYCEPRNIPKLVQWAIKIRWPRKLAKLKIKSSTINLYTLVETVYPIFVDLVDEILGDLVGYLKAELLI
ncbi:AAA-type ATPase family protein, partial [Striga asiatica]